MAELGNGWKGRSTAPYDLGRAARPPDGTPRPIEVRPRSELSRRDVLGRIGAGAALLGVARVLGTAGVAAASPKTFNVAKPGKLVVGFVSPQTGALAGFATSNNFAVQAVRQTAAFSKALRAGGQAYDVEIVVEDSQSDPNRASEVARDLILSKRADLIITSSTPETDNPVALLCESEGVPCVSTVVPWQSWYAGLGGDPVKPTKKFEYNVMFFFGLEGFAKCFVPMWHRISTDKVVAEMFPNDADGNAFRAAWPGIIKGAKYTPVDGGAYPDGTTSFTSMVSEFKAKQAEIFLCVPLPPDFNTFWKQAAQQDYKPRLATVAKVLLFPADVKALGSLVKNIATDCWWSPFAPYRSALDGQTAAQLAESYQQKTGQQWTQAIGSTYAAFEVAHTAFAKASDPHDHQEVAANLHGLHMSGMNGEVDFTSGPAPGVAVIPAAGVQWKPGKKGKFTDFPYAMFVVDNSDAPKWPVNGTLEPTNP